MISTRRRPSCFLVMLIKNWNRKRKSTKKRRNWRFYEKVVMQAVIMIESFELVFTKESDFVGEIGVTNFLGLMSIKVGVVHKVKTHDGRYTQGSDGISIEILIRYWNTPSGLTPPLAGNSVPNECVEHTIHLCHCHVIHLALAVSDASQHAAKL